jgi:hypothetical protein
MKITKRQWFTFVGIVVLSFVVIVLNNAVNTHPSGIYTGQNVSTSTADDASYLRPVKNYLASGEWKDNSEGIQSYYMRTPGYGLFCLPFYSMYTDRQEMAMDRSATAYIVIIQSMLIALMAGMMYLMFVKKQLSNYLAISASLLFGLTPSFSGYVFYTLTEGITPFLLFIPFLLYLRDKRSIITLLIASLTVGYLVLTRPVFGSFGLLLIPLFIEVKTSLSKKILLGLTAAILVFAPIATWEIRNHNLGKKLEGVDNLHTIYSPSNNTIWRAPHKAIYGLVKQFEINGQAYHDWNHKIESGSSIEKLSIFDDQCVQLFGRDTLSKYTLMYQQTINEAPAFAKQNMYSEKELILVGKFTEFKHQYRSEYKFTSYVKSPAKVLKNIIWQSHLNLHQYWHTYKDSWWIKPFSLLTSLLHLTGYLLPLFFLVCRRKNLKKHWALILATGLFLGYLIFIQIGIEQRYTYPLLPIFYTSSVLIAFKLMGEFGQLFKGRNSSNIGSGD